MASQAMSARPWPGIRLDSVRVVSLRGEVLIFTKRMYLAMKWRYIYHAQNALLSKLKCTRRKRTILRKTKPISWKPRHYGELTTNMYNRLEDKYVIPV